jgi:hypothetical protein
MTHRSSCAVRFRGGGRRHTSQLENDTVYEFFPDPVGRFVGRRPVTGCLDFEIDVALGKRESRAVREFAMRTECVDRV